MVDTGIFPGEGVDVLLVELGMFGEELVVADTPVVVLVEERRQGQVRREVDNGRLVCLGPDFWDGALDGLGELCAVVGWREVRGLGQGSVQTGDGVVVVESEVLLASDEDIVRNTAEQVVAFAGRDDGSKAVLEVVPASGLEVDTVDVEPSAPEDTAEPVDVAVRDSAGVVSSSQVDDVLDCSSKKRKKGGRGLRSAVLPIR